MLIAIFCSLAIAFSLFSSSALSAGGQLVRVVDGDTIELDGDVYRLHGIDAPEAGQSCNSASGGSWECGKEAISMMINLTGEKHVECDRRDNDAYGRTIGVCTADDIDLNEAMVKAGLAWAFRKYSNDYAHTEEAARALHVGVWQRETEPPWDYRARKWEIAVQIAPSGCPIKGNISDGGQIYHPPWSPWYEKTKLDLSKGERWFCSEEEAVAAGWRAPYWGR